MAARRSEARGSARVTIDHDEIMSWVEEHGGTPAVVKRTRGRGAGGILRVDFPGFSGEDSLEPISWDEFFARFDESGLAFLYQDKTSAGRPSNFNKLVARESVGLSPEQKRATRGSSRGNASSSGRSAAGARKTSARTTSTGARGRSGGRATRAANSGGTKAAAGTKRKTKRTPQRAASEGSRTRRSARSREQ